MTILKIIKSFIQNWHFFPSNILYYQPKLLPLKQNKYDLIIRQQKSKNIRNSKMCVLSKNQKLLSTQIENKHELIVKNYRDFLENS